MLRFAPLALLIGAGGADVSQGFDARIAVAPQPGAIGDRTMLVYELALTSFAAAPVTLTRVEVRDGERVIADLAGDALAAAIGRTGSAPSEGVTTVTPGARATLYLNLSAAAAPRTLRHRLTFTTAGAARTLDLPAVAVDRTPLPELGPPLRGGPWVAVYDPAMERGHRRVFYAVDGTARLPGRFAIDWFSLADAGRDEERLQDWRGYGAPVLAVADGTVVAVRDDVPDPAALRPFARPSIGDATGNYVALDIGGGRIAFYEHLKHGAPVRSGQRVRRGEVVGALGYTGQTTGPHLHFHLADANAPLAAEGRPYRVAGAQWIGGYASIAAFAAGERWQPRTPAVVAFPPANAVVRFPDR